LLTEADDLEYDKEVEIIVICQHGLRSETARRTLTNIGFNKVRNLAGGLLAIRKLDL
jgi:rhodanese-related sulfurtransferase